MCRCGPSRRRRCRALLSSRFPPLPSLRLLPQARPQGRRSRRSYMSARALEFVETWVSEKIEAMETLPAEGDEAAAKTLANECLQAALEEDIPAAEIQEAFDDLAEFIDGEIEEERDRREEDDDEGSPADEDDDDK